MIKTLKICSPQLGLSPNSDLGGEVHDHFVVQGIANLGHKIFIYLPKERFYQKNRNILVTHAPFKHILAITFNLLIIPYLFKTYKKNKFDILRVHNPYFIGLGAIIFKLFHSKVFIVATHHLISNSFFFDLINHLTIKKYDAIITVSNYLKKNLINKYKIPHKKIHVIYNGVTQDYKFAVKDQRLVQQYHLQNKIVLIFMGLLIDRKNPMFLLRLYKTITLNYQNISLIICGRGPLEEKMKNFVKNNKIRNVIFIGRVIGKAKIDHLNLGDIFIHPAKEEGLPLSVLEAMACRKPIVISDAYSAQEIVRDGQNGFICKINNKNDWLEKIHRLIISENLRKKMGKISERLIKEKFQWQYCVRDHIKIYKSLAKIY